MDSILEKWIQRDDQYPDGSMKPEYRQRLQKKGFSEQQIAQMEARGILNVKIALEDAASEREYQKGLQEYENGEGKRIREEVERMNKGYNHSGSSVKKLPQQTRAQQMAGLDTEELLSQGYAEMDDFYYPNDEVEVESSEVYAPIDRDIPDIPF